MTTFAGKAGVDTYRAIALISGLKLYAKTKMRPNRMWTPTNMLKLAGLYTGKHYKRGQFDQAIEDMQGWVATYGTRGQ
jgi:hypothetical protein